MEKSKASFIAKGGLLIALTLIILYLGNIITFNTLFLLGVASAIIPLGVIICDVKTAILVYVASAILAYFILPDKITILLYILIFGPYGLVKLFIEKRQNTTVEIILKLVYFNVITFIAFIIYKQFFMPTIELQYPLIAIFLIGNIAFIVFDYVLTVFANFMSKHKF